MYRNVIYCIFGALIWSDLFNFIFNNSPLVIWKQVVVAIAWVQAMRFDLISKIYLRSIFAFFITLLLISWSVIFCGVDIDIAIFNSFLYLSWVPIYVIFRSVEGKVDFDLRKFQYYSLILFVASIIGLYVDWHTDYFNWIEKQVSSVALLESLGAARRASFFFIASTMVIPLIAAPGILFYLANPTKKRGIIISIGLLLAVLPTGSGSSMIVAVICCIGFFAAGGNVHFVRSVLIAPVALLLIFTGSIFSDNKTQLQAERLLTAFDSETEANVGRVDFWDIAIHDISSMNGFELVFGSGLGVTNDNKGNIATYFHGESSFFQAMIEAGFLGFISRLLPFLLIAIFFVSNKKMKISTDYLVIVFWTIASFLAIATAPTFGNIPFQAVLAFMISLLAKKEIKNYAT